MDNFTVSLGAWCCPILGTSVTKVTTDGCVPSALVCRPDEVSITSCHTKNHIRGSFCVAGLPIIPP